jgi:hypothetical protein
VATYAFSQRLYPIHYGWGKPLRLFAVATAVGTVTWFVQRGTTMTQIGIGVAAFTAYLLVTWTLVLDADDRALAMSAIRSPKQALRLLTGK